MFDWIFGKKETSSQRSKREADEHLNRLKNEHINHEEHERKKQEWISLAKGLEDTKIFNKENLIKDFDYALSRELSIKSGQFTLTFIYVFFEKNEIYFLQFVNYWAHYHSDVIGLLEFLNHLLSYTKKDGCKRQYIYNFAEKDNRLFLKDGLYSTKF